MAYTTNQNNLIFLPALKWMENCYRTLEKGYATEGAKAALDYAFNILNKDKVVSFTATVNKPSQAVMERLGMRKVKYFNHPKLPNEHALQKHVLYEIYHPKLEL